MTEQTSWTPEREELLRELHTQGSNAWIAREINARTGSRFSRNAIIGKRLREHLKSVAPHGTRRGNQIQPRQRRKNEGAPKYRVLRKKRKVFGMHGVSLPPDFSLQDIRPAGEFRGLTLLQLEAGQCCYPTGGDNGEPFLFCGLPTQEDSSYCPACHARCWEKPKRKFTKRDVNFIANRYAGAA